MCKRPNNKMSNNAPAFRSFQCVAALSTVLFVGLSAKAQSAGSQLPPTPPTTLPQQPATGAAAAACVTPPCNATSDNGAPKPTRPHHATVTFSDGQLTVAANDSSLHQILRSIANQTGMTITGGVEEQRVFGTYGPAAPATILPTLLDGTGVNVLLQDGPDHVPSALVLTQRTGGPAPAPITAQDAQIGADEPSVVPAPQPAPRPATSAASVPSSVGTSTAQPGQPQPGSPQPAQIVQQPQQVQQVTAPAAASVPPSIPQPANNVLGNPNNVTPTASQIPTTNSVPLDALPTPSTTVQTQQGIVDTPNPPPASSAPTPDSVFQQLLQMQKAKAAAAASPGSQSTTPPPATTPPQ